MAPAKRILCLHGFVQVREEDLQLELKAKSYRTGRYLLEKRPGFARP